MSKLAVITGANAGIGLEASIQLLKLDYRVIMCCRSIDKAEVVRVNVINKFKIDQTRLMIVQVDLADLENIDHFRSRFEQVVGKTPIDLLILNAGVFGKCLLSFKKFFAEIN